MSNELETLAEFDVVAKTHDLAHVVVQSLDLLTRGEALATCRVDGALFMGCDLTVAAADDLRERGALLFPRIPDTPLEAYRATLYRASNLYDTSPQGHYSDSFDARAYAWTRASARSALTTSLVESLHDHAISDALEEFLAGRSAHHVVGIMGGHAMLRDSEEYARTAALAMALTDDGFLVSSGGGPGAMEAANLGARLHPHGPDALAEALTVLAGTPSFRPSVDDWVRTAFDVKTRFAGGADTLGIPTWFYGHEPPNAFATHIAKYCSNALREDELLRRCRGGLVYLPGAAGTVQELFQAVTGNYYAADESLATPLVLVGVVQWTETLPAWPLLKSLAHGRPMDEQLVLVDSMEEAGEWLVHRWQKAAP